MRGEFNAIGIPTKKRPGMHPDDFFTDEEYDYNVSIISNVMSRIPSDATVVIPLSGIGTGLSQLRQRAPMTYSYLMSNIYRMMTNSLIEWPHEERTR